VKIKQSIRRIRRLGSKDESLRENASPGSDSPAQRPHCLASLACATVSTVYVVPGLSMKTDKTSPAISYRGSVHWSRLLSAALTGALFILPAEVFSQDAMRGPEIRKSEVAVASVSPGIGYDSRINLPRFSLRLFFTTKSQKHLANIDAELSHFPWGKPTRIHSIGPWLHDDLPSGRYRLKARTSKGQEIGRFFEIVSG
jgi:hypothetical protein